MVGLQRIGLFCDTHCVVQGVFDPAATDYLDHRFGSVAFGCTSEA